MQTLMQRYGIGSGVVISAVDLIKGIGVYAGLESIDVEGATGLYNTNYEGKRRLPSKRSARTISYFCTSKPATKRGTRAMSR